MSSTPVNGATGVHIGGTLHIHHLLAFVFGVVFISVMLVFATQIPNPTQFQQWVFIVVVALAGAGIGAVIPGVLNYKSPYLTAGGALAVFVIIFLLKPALLQTVTHLVTPSIPAEPVAQAYLAKVDAFQFHSAWEQLDVDAREGFAKDRSQFDSVYETARKPLGQMTDRKEIGVQQIESPPGLPFGLYRSIIFMTKFVSGNCYNEQVTVRATNDLSWRVWSHAIVPMPVPCLPNQ
jgi:hypothetical protein